MKTYRTGYAKEGRALRSTKLTIEPDPRSGGLRVSGELDFTIAAEAHAELAARLHTVRRRIVDLTGLTALAVSGATVLEELLEDDIELRCSATCPAYTTLLALGLGDRVRLVPVPRRMTGVVS